MTRGTKENGLREQAVKSLSCIANTNHRLKLATRQPLRGISAFERLKAEWICANPSHTESELLAACITFAHACGLILMEKVLEAHRHSIAGGDYDRN